MAFQDLADAVDAGKRQRDRLIAVYIGILAVILAVAGVGGGNATKDATARNIEAANTWAFFQAKNIRRHEIRLMISEFEVLLATQPGMPEAARAMIDERMNKLRADEARYTSEPDTGEGTKELSARAKELEKQRDLAMSKDPYFDYGQAMLQIAIVLASVAIITGGSALLVLSGLLSALGTVLTLNGFLLFYHIPYIG
ncbi:DUF4337 domain-containing protein [Hyphomicrobium sp. NDB2Meth4]|uniref:DUF4337 domain-containing protein n=1 Tax=Hyphomicrobium sp. NDB2Meth4 TaxID=1892846 RepID=UPI000931C5B8|nr:DUF4337 domain-containing protein [Hyphomicrobium sp. NDB2Meth4]